MPFPVEKMFPTSSDQWLLISSDGDARTNRYVCRSNLHSEARPPPHASRGGLVKSYEQILCYKQLGSRGVAAWVTPH